MKQQPREKTVDEVRSEFLDHVAGLIDYWDINACSVRAKLEGLAFSILVMLDSGTLALPGFRVLPHPHESDEAVHREEGRNWYPNDVDIAGDLHDHLFNLKETRRRVARK